MPGTPDIFATIQTLKQNILDGDQTAASARISDIDLNLKNATAMRSEVGSRIATLENAADSLLDSKTSLSSLLSKTEDADLAETIMELQTRENMYQASVSTASRILSMSLTDYFDIPDEDAHMLGLQSPDQAVVLTTVTVDTHGSEVTTNLLGPIVINSLTLDAKQIVVQDERYGTRHLIGKNTRADRAARAVAKAA